MQRPSQYFWPPCIVYLWLALDVAAASTNLNPCFTGVCTTSRQDFTMTIRGPANAIGDLTTEGGWGYYGTSKCDSDKSITTVHFTCQNEDLCKNLHEDGAVGKVVRVPFECSETGFAILTQFDNIGDNGHANGPYVAGIDPEFKTPPTKEGRIEFEFEAQAPAGEDTDPDATLPDNVAMERRGVLHKHFPFHLKRNLKDLSILGAKATCERRTNDTAQDDKSAGRGRSKGAAERKRLHSKRRVKMSAEAGFSVTLSAEVDMHLGTGVHVIGTYMPPGIDKFEVYGKMDGKIQGTIKIAGSATGTLTTDNIPVLSIPISSIPSIPHVFSIGPQFELLVRPELKVNATLEQEIGFGYVFDSVGVFVPETSNSTSGGSIRPIPSKQSLKLGSMNVELEAAVHVVPRLSFGITTFGEKSDVHVEADISGIAGLTLERLNSDSDSDNDSDNDSGKAKAKARAKAKKSKRADTADPYFEPADHLTGVAKRDVLSDLGLKGCSYVKFGVALNIGASLDLLKRVGVVDASPSKTLFEKTYELIRECSEEAQQKKKPIPAPKVNAYITAMPSNRWAVTAKPDFVKGTAWENYVANVKAHVTTGPGAAVRERSVYQWPDAGESSLVRRAKARGKAAGRKSRLKCARYKPSALQRVFSISKVGQELVG